jgi:hypothetical protein
MSLQKYDLQKMGSIILRAASGLTISAEFLGLGILFYLGTFTRLLADDYCEIMMLKGGSLLSVVYQTYMLGNFRAANRFSRLIFVQGSELLGPNNIQLVPTLMIVLWLIGLLWLIYEIRKLIGVQLPFLVDLFMGVSIIFFSAIQAPNRFQTFFWRSSIMTHFAPVVFMGLLVAFIFFLMRRTNGRSPAFWWTLFVFLSSFLIGGISEPPAALLVVVHALLLVYFWRRKGSEPYPAISLIWASLFGTFLALIVMFLAPGNLLHGKTTFIILPLTVVESIKFTFEFMRDTLRTLPIPSLISLILSGQLFFALYLQPNQPGLSPIQRRNIGMALVILPLLSYLLIAVTFAPSAYGQAYPVERARFIGRFLMTAALMLEGALLGVWFAQLEFISSYRRIFFPMTAVLLLVFGLYPLRGGLSLWKDVDEYRAWATEWDAREQLIHDMAESGVQDPVVEWFPNRYGVKDIDGSTEHWMNKCVSDYYGFNTIRSVPMGE